MFLFLLCRTAIIGIHIICEYVEYCCKADTLPSWQTALDILSDSAIPVKTTNNFSIRLGPDEVKTLNGVTRNTEDINTAVTEHINNSLSGDLTICSRVDSFKSPGTTVRVPVSLQLVSTCYRDISKISIMFIESSQFS